VTSYREMEAAAIESEIDRLKREPIPATWDRDSWTRGALYALTWVLGMRSAAMAPLDAARIYVPRAPGTLPPGRAISEVTGLPPATEPAAEPTATACFVCGGDNPRGCPACNGSGVISLGASLDPGAAGTIAYKPCGCAAEWWGAATPADHLVRRRQAWAEMGYRSEPMAWQDAAPLLTQGASCTHAPPARESV
jgi:hypothetical protein